MLTFGERRKRADIEKIKKDYDLLESAFLAEAQKINPKRQEQIVKRVSKILPQIAAAHEAGNSEEVEALLQSLKMPSSKEYYKAVRRLIQSSAKLGVLRAHKEIEELKKRYFSENEYDFVDDGTYEVIFSEEALAFVEEYAYEVGVITEATILNKIREAIAQGLTDGLTPKEITDLVLKVAGSWMSPKHAQTIARVESAKMYNAGRLSRYTDPDMDGFVVALQYDAIMDNRTTDVCRHLDGKMVAISNTALINKFTPPNHYQCRATWLPVTKYEDWKANLDGSVEPQKGFDFQPPESGKLSSKVQKKRSS